MHEFYPKMPYYPVRKLSVEYGWSMMEKGEGESRRKGRRFVLNKQWWKRQTIDLLCDVVGSLSYSVGIYTFAKMADFAPGGLSGLALMTNYLWNVPIGITTLILNVPFILLSWRYVGRRFLIKTVRTMIFCTFFMDVVFPCTPAYEGSQFMAALYSGVFLGAGLALFYMRGTSSGGTDFLTMTVKALRPHLSIGAVTMSIDLVIIVLGWPVFGNVDAILYGLAATFVTSVVIDKILYGVGAGTMVIIITDQGQQIADKIGMITGRGSTAIKAKGTYTKQEKQVLICACSNAQSYTVRSAVHETDENAFVMLTETSQVYGEGFRELKVPEKK